jgi:hypothetical protein
VVAVLGLVGQVEQTTQERLVVLGVLMPQAVVVLVAQVEAMERLVTVIFLDVVTVAVAAPVTAARVAALARQEVRLGAAAAVGVMGVRGLGVAVVQAELAKSESGLIR